MPNCDFYSVGNDFEEILGFIFGQLECRVFEMYSPFGEEVVEFSAVGDVTGYCGYSQLMETGRALYLTLWPLKASATVNMRRLKLNPDSCDGHTFRYEVTGWGLIQLYLGGLTEKGLEHSHTNHNSQARAESWAPTYADEMGSPGAWNWTEVTRVSNKLNRYIRKHAATKLGSRPVLPQANEVIECGATAL